MPTNLDLDCLRTFVAISDTGSFAAAGQRVGRSLSAVSLQMGKLEGQVGQQLFAKVGRRMLPTPAGTELLDHARTILSVNDAAVGALSQQRLSGRVRMGLLHDVLEVAVADALDEFSKSQPGVSLEIVVDRSTALIEALEAGRLDQVVAFEIDTRLPFETVARGPAVWVGQRPGTIAALRPLPLVLLDEPCTFRRDALAALDNAGIPWRIVLTSPSLSAVRAAARAGLGVTARTPHFVGRHHERLCMLESLPALPEARLRFYRRPGKMSEAAAALKEALVERLTKW